MKITKRILSLALVLMLVLSLATTAFAADGTTGTIVNSTDRAYKAYQIFSGTQAKDDSVLGAVAWGSGINSTAFLNALKSDSTCGTVFSTCATPADVAGKLSSEQNNSAVAKAFANVASKHLTTTAVDIPANQTKTLASGYYLLMDQTNVADKEMAKNPALLQITNGSNLAITEKYGIPQIEKAVTGAEKDFSIGDEVTFTLTATMPNTVEGYEAYKIVFHDTLSSGLTYVDGSATVTVAGSAKTGSFTVTPSGNSLTISCADVLPLGATASSAIVVTYKAKLNANAVIGTNGNSNKVKLEFSNDPNGTGTGMTTEKEVKVYTWEIPVFKYTKGEGDAKNPLEGAGFELYSGDKQIKFTKGDGNIYKVDPNGAVTEIITDGTGKFEIEGLAQGSYTLKEKTVPAGYNKCDDVTVVIGANGELTQNGTATTEVGIQNNAGSTLPETGGVGTTMFYIFGSVMVLAAVVLLVTKKRMASAE